MYSVLVFAPLTIVIILALITRKMAESMTAGVLVAMALLYKERILTGTIDSVYEALTDSSYQFCLILIILFGGIIQIFQESGALEGFAMLMSKMAKGPKMPMIIAWIMSFVMFVDEYLNSVTVAFSMRDITDRNGIPREHLAFQVHAMACCICATVPFTSWIGFSVSLVGEYGLDYSAYLKAVPLMFYPLLFMLTALLLDLGIVPKVGTLKGAYERVSCGGPAFLEEEGENLVDLGSEGNHEPCSWLNAIVPIVFLIAGTLIFDNDLIYGLVICLAVQFVMYVPQKIMTVGKFFEHFFNGAKGMTSIAIVVLLGFILSTANEKLGFFDIILGVAAESIPPFIIPLAAFIVVAFCVFAVGGCWVVMLITMPVFVPMAQTAGADPILTVSAIMSGICFGYSTCFYADTVFMCTAGTGVSTLKIIKTTLPYALAIAVLSCAAYAAAGFLMHV